MNTDLMFSSKSGMWATPQDFYDSLNAKWNFELDVCATADTAKCPNFISPEQDCLKMDWGQKRCFMNPPYGRSMGKFIAKAYEEAKKGAIVVCLLPARTDTKNWFHKYIWDGVNKRFRPGVTPDFISGRLVFGTDAYWEWLWSQEFLDGKINKLYGKVGKKNPAPFPSMVVVFNFRDEKVNE